MEQRPERFDRWLMVGVFALSLALRLLPTLGFDGLYGQDPYAYYTFAETLRLTISQGGALPPFFWPLGYPALLALGFALFGASALTAQAINLLLGALLAPLVYLLARQVGARLPGAFAAALIVAICGQAIQSSFVVMADIPALFWATLSAVALLRSLSRSRTRWLMVAALTLALACVTRWLYLALIPVWGAALLLTWQGIRWRASLAAGVAAVLVLLPQAAISIGSPYPVLNHAWVEGWTPANAFAHSFSNVDGTFDYAQINAQYYAQPYYDPYYLAPLFAPFALVGLWALRRRRAWLVLLLGWALLPYLFLAGIPYQNIRFPLIVVPAVAALAGLGLERLLPRYRLIFAALLMGGVILTASADAPILQTFIANQTRDKNAVQWAIQHVPADARLYTFGLTEPLEIDGAFEVHELYDESPQTISAQLTDGKASYLFANIWVIENQWVGRELDDTYRWLRDGVGLQYLDRIGNYILFKVDNENWHLPAGLQFPQG